MAKPKVGYSRRSLLKAGGAAVADATTVAVAV